MANKITTGLSGAHYCLPNGTSKSLCRSVSVSASIDVAEAVRWYSDNGLQESSAPYFNNGTISFNCDSLADATIEEIFGVTAPTSPDTWLAYNRDNTAVKCAVGFVARMQVNGVVSYVPVIFPSIQFKPFALNAASQTESVTFQETQLEGTIFADANGNWKYIDGAEYTTEAAAITALQTKLAEVA